MKKIIALVLALVMVVALLAGCGGSNTPSTTKAAAETITLTFGHGQAETHSYNLAALKFKEMIEEKSNGTIKVNVQPNGALGDEKESAEALQMGTMDMTVLAVAVLTGFDSSLDVFNLPYLFENREHAMGVLDSEIATEAFAGLQKQGLRLAGFFDLGFRSMTNSKRPINTPDDCKGLRMRTLQSSVLVEGLNMFGIDAVSMGFGELFTAMQTGNVDGQENPISVIDASRFYEVQKYLSLTEHMYVVLPVLISEKTWEKLSSEQQALLTECIKEMVKYQREQCAADYDAQIADLKANGMEVNDVDKAAFMEAIKPLYEKYKSQFGETLEKIQNFKH